MRMHGLLFGGLFWGILISLIGLSIVLKYMFGIDFHFGRIFFGIVIILLGVRVIVGHHGWNGYKHMARSQYVGTSGELNIIFSSGRIDLTNYAVTGKLPKEINVIFGSGEVIIPDSLALDVNATTVFGTTILPNHMAAGFGEDSFRVGEGQTVHHMETNAIFGRLEFIRSNKATTDSTATRPDSVRTGDNADF